MVKNTGTYSISIFLFFFLFVFIPNGLVCSEFLNIATNLILNPDFSLDSNQNGLPVGWNHGNPDQKDDLIRSRFGWEEFHDSGKKAIWVVGGKDRQGEWFCEISDIKPDNDYLLTFFAFRETFLNKIYPEVEIMGQTFVLDNHCTFQMWQYFQIPLHSAPGVYDTTLRFINPYPVRFYFYQPRLIKAEDAVEMHIPHLTQSPAIFDSDFFPIGIFGAASPEDLKKIKQAGFNTVLIRPEDELVDFAHKLGLKVVISIYTSNDISEAVQGFRDHPALLAWYIADEPEIKSMTPDLLRTRLDQLMAYDTRHPSCMTIVRSRFASLFKDSCHIFMLDQYPIPHQPITWLSDSLDEAGKVAGPQRIWAVIQAFGSMEFAARGWPVFPTFDEMRSLAYLGLVHQAKGLFFYSFKYSSSDPEKWEKIRQVVSELKDLSEWFVRSPEQRMLELKILSPYKVDARGSDAVHYKWIREKSEAILIMVNTIDKEVEISLDGLPKHINRATVLFEKRKIAIKNGNIRDVFGPHQTHIYKMSGLIPSAPYIMSQSRETGRGDQCR